VFIIDETSMIAGRNGMSLNYLLDDLIQYCYSKPQCKIIFIGDTAQLPPVGSNLSPALNKNYMRTSYDLEIEEYELNEVMRQKEDSGILANASNLRDYLLLENFTIPKFNLNYPDIQKITGYELEDELNDSYSNYGENETIVVSRSNKRANLFNQQIRARIKYLEGRIEGGDKLMVVKNNYFWLPETADSEFIANGDILDIQKVVRIERKHGFDFADVSARLVDYPNEDEIDVKILLNAIDAEGPTLSSEDRKRLYESLLIEYDYLSTKRDRVAKIKKDPYANALQVKFAYAVTCHKSQGGQWKSVFVDQGYLTEEMIDKKYVRWIYTAITRASEKLYLVNFSNVFFEEED
jgi:exodeoxyribonuclease-5